MLCYHYDGATGKYAVAAMSLVRLGGVATIALIVIGVLWAWRRERRAGEGGVNPLRTERPGG